MNRKVLDYHNRNPKYNWVDPPVLDIGIKENFINNSSSDNKPTITVKKKKKKLINAVLSNKRSIDEIEDYELINIGLIEPFYISSNRPSLKDRFRLEVEIEYARRKNKNRLIALSCFTGSAFCLLFLFLWIMYLRW
jgi:hypothetical protein